MGWQILRVKEATDIDAVSEMGNLSLIKFILDFEFNLLQVRSISNIKIILFQTLLKTVLQFTLVLLALAFVG